jgi:hypothetical protein
MAKRIHVHIKVRDSMGNVTVYDAAGLVDEPPVIDEVVFDPPMVPSGSLARLTIRAHDPENDTLTYEVVASEGTIERTDQPNVFIWRAP